MNYVIKQQNETSVVKCIHNGLDRVCFALVQNVKVC